MGLFMLIIPTCILPVLPALNHLILTKDGPLLFLVLPMVMLSVELVCCSLLKNGSFSDKRKSRNSCVRFVQPNVELFIADLIILMNC